ncbi:MAG: hypothetical protein DLM55_04255 [Acidimicrobiales bacterium]|nr:MAG: hypothetical protein DLM55_04255 [Acidimicrobiales bacterium]
MKRSTIGLGIGMALGFAAAFGGFSAFLLVAGLGAIGLLAGKVLDGELDLSELLSFRGRR